MANRFLVPQFLDVEPRIVGPVTVRQFLILMFAAFVDFVLWRLFSDRYQNYALAGVIFNTLVWGMVAFAKVNGQSFHYFFLNIVRTFKKPRLRVWAKVRVSALPAEEAAEVKERIPVKKLPPKSHLSDLSLVVDTGGAYNVDVKKRSVSEPKIEEINI